MKYPRFYCIVRQDSTKPKSYHAWEVKIIRRENSFYRSFSDRKFGGKQQALVAAMKCRDKEVALRPRSNSYENAIRLKRTNSSGIVGVRGPHLKVIKRGKKTWSYEVFTATGTPESGGPSKTKDFYIAVWGKRVAKAMAIEQRRQWEEELRLSVEAKLKGKKRC